MTEETAVSSPDSSRAARTIAVGVAFMLGAYLLITSTVTLHETLWKYDVKRVLEFCLFPLIFSAVLFVPELRNAFRGQATRMPSWMPWALGAIVALGVISSAVNSASTWSLIYSLSEVALLSLLGLAVFCVAACRAVGGVLFDQVTVVLLAMVGLAVGLQELLGVVAALGVGVEFHPRIALLHFSWPRFYNQVQAWSIPVIAALPLLFPGKPLAKLLCISALALEWYVVIATGARGTTVGVVLAIVIACVLFPTVRRPLISYQVGGLAAGTLIYLAVVFGHHALLPEKIRDQQPTTTQSDSAAARDSANPVAAESRPVEDSERRNARNKALQKIGDSSGEFMEPITGIRMATSSGRIVMWRGSLKDTKDHPLLGIGPMNYACTGPLFRAGHPHSFPLQFLSEWGTPAFVVLLVVSGMATFYLIRRLRHAVSLEKHSVQLPSLFAVGVLAAVILSGLDGVFMAPASQVTAILIGGALLGLVPAAASTGITHRSVSLAPSLVLTVGLLASIAVLMFAEHEIRVSSERFEQTALLDRGIPRMWQNGKVCRLYIDGTY